MVKLRTMRLVGREKIFGTKKCLQRYRTEIRIKIGCFEDLGPDWCVILQGR